MYELSQPRVSPLGIDADQWAPGDTDDERIFRLDRHLFRVGEYVTVTEPDNAAHTFKVVSVR